MKKLFTLITLTITFSMNAQMSDNSSGTSATGSNAVAMGNGTTASGGRSTAMGSGTIASGNNSTAMGYFTTASGNKTTAMGANTTASDYASLVIGQFNSSGSSVTNNATSYNTANTAFVIGNGTDSSNKSDAFKVMFNGDAYISSTLYIGGTAITSTAAEINLLDGVTATTAEIN